MTDTTSDKLLDESIKLDPSTLPKSRKGWGLLLGGLLLVAGGSWTMLRSIGCPDSPEALSVPTIAVETIEITSQPLVNTLELSGTIRPLEQAVLSTRVMGRITQLSLEAGDRFSKGQVLAQIDVLDITAQTDRAKFAVAQAESNVVKTEAELARSQAMLKELESQKLEVKATLELAIIDRNRMAKLQSEGAVSQERLDRANTTFARANAKMAQTEAAIAQARAAISQSQAAIAESRARVAEAKSSVTSASVDESYGKIIAPFDGVVVEKLAYEGEMAAPGTSLLKVENPHRLQLEISVPEENLSFVGVGRVVPVRVDAVDRTFKATIEQIVPAADPQSRSFLVKIPLNNSEGLISGMFGRIILSRGTNNGISIPTSALIQRGQLQGVYGVETNSSDRATAVLRWVKTGKIQNDRVEIISGLMPGDRIITNRVERLSDGQPVAIQE